MTRQRENMHLFWLEIYIQTSIAAGEINLRIALTDRPNRSSLFFLEAESPIARADGAIVGHHLEPRVGCGIGRNVLQYSKNIREDDRNFS